MEYRRHIKSALFIVNALHLEYRGEWRFIVFLLVAYLHFYWQNFLHIVIGGFNHNGLKPIMFWSADDGF